MEFQMQPLILTISLVVMAVVALLFWGSVRAASRPPQKENTDRRRTQLIWGMAIFGVFISIASLREWPHAIASDEDAVVVNVTGGQWWWEIDTEEVPLGKPVNFFVTTEDVNHGMGIYNSDMRLLVQVQAMPGYTNKVTYTFNEPGLYQVLCMEYCGVSHHDMTYEFNVVAVDQ